MEGRIIALRVSDTDFEKLEGLKKKEGIGWNQLLLVPVEATYSVSLETARPVKKAKVEAEAEHAETGKKKGGKGKKAEAQDSVAEAEEAVPEVVPETQTETEG